MTNPHIRGKGAGALLSKVFSILFSILKKERELILYGIFGVGSTVINIAVFHLCGHGGLPLVPSNIIAWFFAFLFAFVTNKAVVFQSRTWTGKAAFREFSSFLAVRLFTLVLDTVLLCILVEWLGAGRLFSKIVVNIVVIAVNYIVSKFIILHKN